MMYLLIIEDRHYDDEYHLFTVGKQAVDAANDRMVNWPNNYHWDVIDIKDKDWLFCASAMDGDYSIIVRRVDNPEH